MDNEIILELVKVQNQFRFLHWQTTSYAKHKAYGKFYDNLGSLIDSIVEVSMGKYGRPEFETEFSITFKDKSSFSMQTFMDNTTNFLLGMSETLDDSNDSDLLNIRDEILAEVNKLKYLLTLD
jgi:hypothetical protein